MCFKCPTPLTEASRCCIIASLSEARQNCRCFTSHGGECEHSCGSFVVQHCADPISTTHTVLPTGGGAGSAGWRRSGPDSGFAGQQLDGGAAHDDGAGGAAAPGVKQVGLPDMQSKQ